MLLIFRGSLINISFSLRFNALGSGNSSSKSMRLYVDANPTEFMVARISMLFLESRLINKK